MRDLIVLFLLFLQVGVGAVAIAADAQVVTPPTPAPKVDPPKIVRPIPATIKATAGKLITIPVDGDFDVVSFVYDHKAFPPDQSIVAARQLTLVTGTNGVYSVTVVTVLAKVDKQITVTITVTGGVDPGPAPVPVPDESLATLTAAVKALTATTSAGFASIAKQQALMTAQLASQQAEIKVLQAAPVVPPVPTKIATSLTFVVLNITQQTADVTEPPAFRQWLKDNGIAVFGITTQAQLDANPRFKGIVSPAIVLHDATGTIIDSAPITTSAAATAFVTRYLKK